ncbi:MAG: PspC domain-containing protein [Prevotella sp.]|nr:PspC domain-containing protein [Prevotella sp.]MBR1556844.1 PspC domain-containing protein [Prevotella sp.]
MKKNITINLCGRLFQIDEDAYEMLQHYIESLRQSFGRQEGGEEIVDDIEARIAELFDELRQNGTEAITIDHVKEIITRIGEPEQLTGDEDEQKSEDTEGHRYDSFRTAADGIREEIRSRTAGKKLFRNPKDKMLAGVLSGFAVFTNTDPVIWRLLMVLFTFCYGFGIILYIVLAIVLPEAKTPEQLLQMEGKEVTPQNLADVVVEKNEQPIQRPNLLRTLFSIMLKILFGFSVAIAMIVCIALCCGFLFALVVLVSALVFPISSTMPFSLEAMGLAELYQTNPWVLILFVVALFLLLLIPIYAIIHMVLSLAGKVQPMGIVQRIVWIILWIAALCTIVPCGITMANYNAEHESRLYHERHQNVYQGFEMNEDDSDFLRRGSWNLIKAENCDHYTWNGQYPNGNRRVRYLDVYNASCEEIIQVERKQEVVPGIYRLDCLVRAEGPGAFVYATADNKQLIEIPAYGDEQAGLYEALKAELSDSIQQIVRLKNPLNLEVPLEAVTNHYSYLDSWSIATIENIVVTGDSIAYGMTSDPTFTGKTCRAKWFSATDFTLTRTGDLPKSKKK